MKKLLVALTASIFLFAGVQLSHASDWDKAGKILTGIEGMRILTGGKIDLVGAMIGAGKHVKNDIYYSNRNRRQHRRYAKHYSGCQEKVWTPHYEWKKRYIPAHEEYDHELGTIYVQEHYIKYRIESGGHWEQSYSCY